MKPDRTAPKFHPALGANRSRHGWVDGGENPPSETMSGLDEARRLIAQERERKTGFLDIGNLGLAELPSELFELTHLKSLVVGSRHFQPGTGWRRSANYGLRNTVQSLPVAIANLQSLDSLLLSDNPVRDLGPLQGLSSLWFLDCLGTEVSDLRPLQGLSSLQFLDCSLTLVSDLGPLQGLSSLQSLACSYTLVSDLGPLQGLSSLQSLDCLRTPVSDLGPLEGLSSLQSLTCSETRVSDLGPLQGLSSLQSLACSGTPVSDLRPLQGLSSLQSLTCSDTLVSDLGPLQGLSSLQSLDLRSTQVSDLGPLHGLSSLQSLTCSYTPVSDLGPLQGLSSLQSLACSGTPVSDLAPLQGLSNLQSLQCWVTPVGDLGPLQGLSSLQVLECSGTHVSDLGPLQGLSSLRFLDCSDTQVSDLGPLQGLRSLRFLGCADTQVSDLGPLQGVSSLRFLDCSRTRVSDLGPLTAQAGLTQLIVNESRVSDVPLALVFMDSLNDLRLFHATVPGIPAEVLSGDASDNCLERLRDHLWDLQAGIEEVREAKLVVLGNGRVGKTQICRQLRGQAYDETVPSTHGITVTSEPWAGSTEHEGLNIWDFGGQDIYHGAHTLFMKTSAVFMIAWHPDFEAAGEQAVDEMTFRNYPLAYWLEYVRTLGRKDCPVIVVQTRCDRPQQEVRRLPADDRFLRFPSLKPCWYSAKTPRGQGALEEALRDAIAFLRERDGIATIGAGRMRVLRQLESWRNEDQERAPNDRQHRTLSQEEFRALCEEMGGVNSPESLLEYLHNLGAVFYRANLFRDRIILDQSWALEAVYAVFDRRKAFPLILSQGGRFTRSLLAMTAWREFSEPEQRLFLSLMESCGISFVHRPEDRRLELETEYLAPDLLPGKDAMSAQLAGRWNDTEESWRLEYEYPFLHPGLMRALICDVGERSREAGVYWKYGLWVYEKATGCRALLEQHMTDERRGRITLRLQGRRHEELARWLLERIEDHNRRFGHPDLAPVVDELGDRLRAAEMHSSLYRQAGSAVGTEAPSVMTSSVTAAEPHSVATEPVFDKPPAEFFPSRESQVFVSYAWGDDTAEGRERQRVVDDLCVALDKERIKVRRDQDEMRPGDLISEFMDRLADGDYIIAVISDKYLRSEYCMYELFRIYRNCADKPERFLGRVIPLILADAKLGSLTQRLQRAIHWTNQEAELQPLIQGNLPAVGTAFYAKFKLIGEFARNTSNMLEHLVDKLMPRDFERMAAEGFREVRGLIAMSRRPEA